MKIFTIKSNLNKQIKAKDEEEALEIYLKGIEEAQHTIIDEFEQYLEVYDKNKTILNPPTYKEHAKLLATIAHTIFQASSNEPLDGDQTEEFSMIFQKELDKLNGNT